MKVTPDDFINLLFSNQKREATWLWNYTELGMMTRVKSKLNHASPGALGEVD